MKKGDHVICITTRLSNFTMGKVYKLQDVSFFKNKGFIYLFDDFGDSIDFSIESRDFFIKIYDNDVPKVRKILMRTLFSS